MSGRKTANSVESNPRGEPRGTSRPSGRSTRRTIGAAALVNVAATTTAAVAGLLIARHLGPAGRGQYAAVLAWFGITVMIGEIGQPAALCFYVASAATRGRDYVATAGRLMLASGGLTAVIGWFIAPVLARQDETLTVSFRLMFATCIVSYVGASYLFGLQARSIILWNAARLVQPVGYLALIAVIAIIHHLTLFVAILAFVASSCVQTIVAWLLCRRVDLSAGSFDARLARPLLRYGSSQVAGNAPSMVNARLDQVILAGYAPYQTLGLYAVAVSLSSLAFPVVAAIGNVVFPRIAARHETSTLLLERRAVQASLVLATGLLAVIALLAPWVLPTLFGRAYSQAVPLVWVLCVGSLFLASGQVMGDLLRGRGQPLAVAVAQGVGAAFTVILLIVLLPLFSALGAAIASTIAYLATFVVLAFALRRPGRSRAGPEPVAGSPAPAEDLM
jgi:O-antigen/teichoic acid export membrane protein